jgi:hypothetical protein
MASLLINDKNKFMFIHIHKNGGTSIKDYFLDKGIEFEEHPTLSARKTQMKFLDRFNKYFTFSVFRNPWSRFISFYTFVRQWKYTDDRIRDGYWKFEGGDPKTDDFELWLTKMKFYHNQFPEEKNKPVQEISQFDWVTNDNGKVIVDKIFNLSEINKDWEYFCNRVKIPFSFLPISNSTKHKDYKHYYSDVARKHVARVAEREIDYFKYTF